MTKGCFKKRVVTALTAPAIWRGCMNQKLEAIRNTTDYQGQRRRRVEKLAQRVSAGKGSMMMTSAGGAAQACPAARRASNLCRPSGAGNRVAVYPGLTPWANFLARLRRWVILFHSDMDRPILPRGVSGVGMTLPCRKG